MEVLAPPINSIECQMLHPRAAEAAWKSTRTVVCCAVLHRTVHTVSAPCNAALQTMSPIQFCAVQHSTVRYGTIPCTRPVMNQSIYDTLVRVLASCACFPVFQPHVQPLNSAVNWIPKVRFPWVSRMISARSREVPDVAKGNSRTPGIRSASIQTMCKQSTIESQEPIKMEMNFQSGVRSGLLPN